MATSSSLFTPTFTIQNHQISPSNISFQGLRPLNTTTKARSSFLKLTTERNNFTAIKDELNPQLVISLSTGLSLFLGSLSSSISRERTWPNKACLSRMGLPTSKLVTCVPRNSLLKSNDPVGFNIVDVLAWGSIGHIVAYYILATSSNGYDPKFFG